MSMKTKMNGYLWVAFSGALAAVCLAALPAYAYVGPGLGVALIWTLLGPVAGVISAIAMVAYFPIRYYYKKYKKSKKEKDGETGGKSSP